MDIEDALRFFASNKAGTLATLRADGAPHLSVVLAVPIDGALWISTTQDRVKTQNLRRDPRASFSAGVRPWAAVEGTVRLREGDGVLDDLRRYYREAQGEHPDWEDYDRAMVAERRLIAELVPGRAYGSGG